jgi:hypothetical protein
MGDDAAIRSGRGQKQRGHGEQQNGYPMHRTKLLRIEGCTTTAHHPAHGCVSPMSKYVAPAYGSPGAGRRTTRSAHRGGRRDWGDETAGTVPHRARIFVRNLGAAILGSCNSNCHPWSPCHAHAVSDRAAKRAASIRVASIHVRGRGALYHRLLHPLPFLLRALARCHGG